MEEDSREEAEGNHQQEEGEEEGDVCADGADEVDEGEDCEGYVVEACTEAALRFWLNMEGAKEDIPTDALYAGVVIPSRELPVGE